MMDSNILCKVLYAWKKKAWPQRQQNENKNSFKCQHVCLSEHNKKNTRRPFVVEWTPLHVAKAHTLGKIQSWTHWQQQYCPKSRLECLPACLNTLHTQFIIGWMASHCGKRHAFYYAMLAKATTMLIRNLSTMVACLSNTCTHTKKSKKKKTTKRNQYKALHMLNGTREWTRLEKTPLSARGYKRTSWKPKKRCTCWLRKECNGVH